MVMSSTTYEAAYDSASKGNVLYEYLVSGTSGAPQTLSVVPALTDNQFYYKGNIHVAGATTITVQSGSNVLWTKVFGAAGNADIPLGHTEVTTALSLKSTAAVVVTAYFSVLSIVNGEPVPPEWQL